MKLKNIVKNAPNLNLLKKKYFMQTIEYMKLS